MFLVGRFSWLGGGVLIVPKNAGNKNGSEQLQSHAFHTHEQRCLLQLFPYSYEEDQGRTKIAFLFVGLNFGWLFMLIIQRCKCVQENCFRQNK